MYDLIKKGHFGDTKADKTNFFVTTNLFELVNLIFIIVAKLCHLEINYLNNTDLIGIFMKKSL